MQEHYTSLCQIINQIHGLEAKLSGEQASSATERKFQRIKKSFEEMNLYIYNPIGEDYSETRLDCEASIAGDALTNLKITEVIKPIISVRTGNSNEIIQRAVVIVEGK